MLRVTSCTPRIRQCCQSSRIRGRRLYCQESKPPGTDAIKDAAKPKKNKKFFGSTMKVIGVGAVGLGAVVGYAAYDIEFRTRLEDKVPYSRQALQYAFEYMPAEFPSIHVPKIPGVTRNEEDPESLESISKEAVGSNKQEKQPTKPVIQVIKTDGKSSTVADVSTKGSTAATDKKVVTVDEVNKRIQDKELEEAAENAAIESIISDLVKETDSSVQRAIEMQVKSESNIKNHRMLLKIAMEDHEDDKLIDEQWKAVSKAFEEQILAVSTAERLTNDARLHLEKLKMAIYEGRTNKITKGNKVLVGGQDNVNKLSYSLEQAVANTKKAESSARLMHEFKDLVEQGKKQFQKELESITPSVKLSGRRGNKLTEEELNSLIAHAHRRIEQLQKQLLKQQVLQEESIEMALNRQREEDENLSRQKIKRELEKQKGQLVLEKAKWENEAKFQAEEELKKNLSRQAAAHSDHLADVLRVQRKDLRLQCEEKLRDRLFEERIRFQGDVGSYIARLKGIEAAIDGRAEAEKIGKKAQELWLACMSLYDSICQENLKPLANDLMAIKEAGNDHPFVNAVVSAIPDEAAQEGVLGEDTLTSRFYRVKRIGKRVAMIGEDSDSLFRYVLSFFQSLLVFDSVKAIDPNSDIDLEHVDTFTLLASAERCINNGDLEQAVRFMNQLKGESKKVANDWIKDAILLLETRQAARILLGHASANGIGSLGSM